MENLFIISFGLSGGFGGADNYEVIEANDLEDATIQAWHSACENYENYVGMYGLRTLEEIQEEESCEDDEEVEEIFNEERETWLDYDAKPFSKEYEKVAMDYHYQNDYKEITDKL